MNWNDFLPLLIILSAMGPGIFILFLDEKSIKLRIALNLGGAILTLLLLSYLLNGVYAGETFETRLTLLPNFDLVLNAGALSLLFASLSALLWLVTTIYAIGYFKDTANLSRFFGFFSLCVSATLGIALSGNLITFVIFYELLTLTAYPLLIHKGNEASIKAGKTYLIYTLAGGALLLLGVVWLKTLAGELAFTSTGILAQQTHLDPAVLTIIFGLIIVGLGVKAALVPLHGWLPIAMAAPAPVSALLHAVAVVKAGAFGIIRVVYDVYGIEFSNSLGLTYGLALIASITIIYGSIRALFQDDLKKRLAYSTISQVSYIVLGTAIASPLATIGGIVHLVHQGVMKITLFFCAGNLAETRGIHKVSEMHGIGRKMPITMLAFSVAAFGMIGIPPIAGFVSKWYLGVGAIEAGAYWVVAVLAFSSLLNAMYFLPIIYVAWFKPCKNNLQEKKVNSRAETYWLLLIPPMITALLSLAFGIFSGWIASPFEWAKLIASREYINEFALVSTQSLVVRPSFWWVILAPLIVVFGLKLKPTRKFCLRLAPLVAVIALGMSFMPIGPIAEIKWIFLGSNLILDALGQQMLLLASMLWLLGGIYAYFYLENHARKAEFFSFFLLTMCGNFGLILSHDLLGFISFYTLMSLSAYGLIIFSRSDSSIKAGRSYMKWTIFGEVLLFSGFIWIYFNNSNQLSDSLSQIPTNHWSIGLLIIGFGIKAALLPLHFWLPKAHPVAPIPASALLSGIMVKAGLIGWLRFIPFNGEIHNDIQIDWGIIVMSLGFAGALFGVIVGLTQQNLKSLLAYSTISQMGIIAMAVGTGWYAPSLQIGLFSAILAYAFHHGVVKSALFLSIGIIPCLSTNGIRKILGWLAILVPFIAMIGLPYTSGEIAKSAIKMSVKEIPIIYWLLTITTIGTTLLMLHFVNLVRLQAAKNETECNNNNSLLFIMLVLSGIIISLPFWLPIVPSELITINIWIQLWAAIWPIIIAGLIFYSFSKRISNFTRYLQEKKLCKEQGSFVKTSINLLSKRAGNLSLLLLNFVSDLHARVYRLIVKKYNNVTQRGELFNQNSIVALSIISTISVLFVALLLCQ